MRWPGSCRRTGRPCRCSRCCTATPAASRPRRQGQGSAAPRASRRRQTGRRAGAAGRRSRGPVGRRRGDVRRLADEPGEAFNHLQFAVEDEVDVHRVVLSWRAWAILPLTGQEHAHTLLRQSLRYCLDMEQRRKARGHQGSPVRQVLPKLLDQYKLLGRAMGDRKADDAWIDKLARTIYAASPAAGRRGGGRRRWPKASRRRPSARRSRWRPTCSSCTIRAAWITRPTTSRAAACTAIPSASTPRTRPTPGGTSPASATSATAVASLIVGAYHTAGQTGKQMKEPYPTAEHLDLVKVKDAAALLREAESAITGKDQARACGGDPPLRPAQRIAAAGLRPAAALRHQRRRGAARGEVLPHGERGVRRHAAGLPLAAARGPGPRHRQRVRPTGPRLRRSLPAAEGVARCRRAAGVSPLISVAVWLCQFTRS